MKHHLLIGNRRELCRKNKNTMIALQTYSIKRNASGDRFVCLASGQSIPADVASLATGGDRWLSEITCKCRDCGERFPLRELNGGGQWCDDCQCADLDG
jgi:hypothetical protein